MFGCFVGNRSSTAMRPRESASSTGGREIQFVHVALPPDRVEQRIARDLLLALRFATTPPVAVSSTLSTSSFSRMVTRWSRR